ncbi:aminotransferase class IV [Paragemmobacter kunshanensis]|uniref:aminotransferase class IV n=1 Tax=Paragemmobacter kunshanensis TaxID=2583234 RepID=UPI003742BAB1
MEGALRGGAGDVRLIETALWDGAAFPRLALHLARLARGAAALGFPCDPAAVERALFAAVGDAALRVRLTLGAAGDMEVTVAPLPAGKAEWRVGLAAARLASGDPWLRVKTTRRAAYDAARAALPAGLDEVVFLNERGEVCDGTITTVFFDRGQGMRTPPLACGLLPGVLRAELAVPEEVLRAEDLPRVRLWVGNALRGLIPAVWAGN